MKQITILGATGMVGRSLMQKAINNGLKVRVLARNKEKLGDSIQLLDVVEGDYFDTYKLQNALAGSDVILSTIGPPMTGTISSVDEDKYINSLAFIIKQMGANKQSRWLNISGAGVKMAHENLPLARKLLRVTLKAASKSAIKVKDRELQLLEQSNLEWTNVRPPMIKEEVEGAFCADEIDFSGSAVDLNQLSDFMLAEMTNNEWLRKAPVVGTK